MKNVLWILVAALISIGVGATTVSAQAEVAQDAKLADVEFGNLNWPTLAP